ncbi:MAG: YchJ family protein [Neisseria sp.]|nr:YchJ family protein [Neisseria sp.]
MNTLCPCQSAKPYAECCEPLHNGAAAETAEALMRSRYSAYTLGLIDYIVATTVPLQQPLLDTAAMREWSKQTEWDGLDVLHHWPDISKRHAQVEFKAYYRLDGARKAHHELSGFVRIRERWYFIDPTVPLPPPQAACFCGSARKFKQCCGKVV